jgi:hypothetical protein
MLARLATQIKVALREWLVRMATAYLSLVTLVRTTIIPSVKTASVWGTLAPKYQVAPVITDKLVELE